MDKKQFTWVETYKAISKWLYNKESQQEYLISILQKIGINRFLDKDENGRSFPLKEIDPFTFLSYLNKYKDKERLRYLVALYNELDLTVEKPSDVIGLPTVNAMKVWLFAYKYDRQTDDIQNLWELFRQVVDQGIDNDLFQKVLKIKCVGKGKLSICLFYTLPDYYLPLDSKTSRYIKSRGLNNSYNDYNEYYGIVQNTLKKLKKKCYEISFDAWGASSNKNKSIKISNVSELLDHLKDILDNSDKTEEVYYRGHSSSNYELVPQIYRSDNKYILNEDKMHKELIGYVPTEFIQCHSTFEKLVKMQHYGLPTRLLDITSNPLIALYFACKNKKDETGVLYRFEISKEFVKYYDSDAVSVLSNISRRPVSFAIDTNKYQILGTDTQKERCQKVSDFNEEADIAFLLHEIRSEKPHFQPLIDVSDIEQVYCVKPKLDNPRIIKQNGAFFIFGIKKEKKNPADFNFDKIEFKIDSKYKDDILAQLEVLGVNESTLFPDIDHASQHIKDKYQNKIL